MDLVSHTVLMLTFTIVAIGCLSHINSLIGALIGFLIPAIFIIYYCGKPEETIEKLPESPETGVEE